MGNAAFAICKPFELNDGVVVTADGVYQVIQSENLTYIYEFLCEHGYPVLSSLNGVLTESTIERVPLFKNSWNDLLTTSPKLFEYSIYPYLDVMVSSMVIVVFLTALLFTKHYLTSYKPTWLMRVSCLVASAQLIALNIYSLTEIAKNTRRGDASVSVLTETIGTSKAFNAVYAICYLLQRLTQVDIVKYMYPRRRERRTVSILGTSFVIVATAMWCGTAFDGGYDILTSLYGTNGVASDYVTNWISSESDAQVILSVLVYLLDISLCVVYSSLVYVYSFSKRRFVFTKRNILLTLLMVVAINSPIAFFIGDILSNWFSPHSYVFTLVTEVISNVTTLEWLNRLKQSEKHDQRGNVLGRQVYVDDYYESSTDESYFKTRGAQSSVEYNLKQTHYDRLRGKLKRYQQDIHKRMHSKVARINHQKDSIHLPQWHDDDQQQEVFIYEPKQVAENDTDTDTDNASSGTDEELVSVVDSLPSGIVPSSDVQWTFANPKFLCDQTHDV